jgi:hypothetical protein
MMKKSKQFLLKITGISEESFEIIRFELNMVVLRIRNKIDPIKIIRINKIKNTNKEKLNLGANEYADPMGSYVPTVEQNKRGRQFASGGSTTPFYDMSRLLIQKHLSGN